MIRIATVRGVCLAAMTFLWIGASAQAAPILLQNGAATTSLTGLDVGQASDGTTTGAGGWSSGGPGTAVWETATDVGMGAFNVTLNQAFGFGHMIGRFRISVTTDDRSMFADGLANGGDVTANWIVLSPTSVTVPAGMTFSVLGDDTIITGNPANTGDYVVGYNLGITGVTGIRIELVQHPALPLGGPGYAANGNFVLTELSLDAVVAPEPGTAMLVALGLVALGVGRRRRR